MDNYWKTLQNIQQSLCHRLMIEPQDYNLFLLRILPQHNKTQKHRV